MVQKYDSMSKHFKTCNFQFFSMLADKIASIAKYFQLLINFGLNWFTTFSYTGCISIAKF